MSHEFTSTDGLVLAGRKAWHGLGVVVESCPSAAAALPLAQLEWAVEQWSLTAKKDDQELAVASHVLNVRADTRTPLGVVGVGYQPVQNRELAAFCDALSSTGQVQIESAGSIRGGKRVWLLLRGESVWVNSSDEVRTYLLVANAHDGSLAVTCQPTTIRVVCSNTLHASLAQGANATTTVRFRHEGAIGDKLEDARRALGVFTSAREEFARQAEVLAAKSMSREELQRFWLEVYTATVDEIPANPTTTAEHRRVESARYTLSRWASNFDRDRAQTLHTASAWCAVNAVTEWFDHQRPVRAASEVSRNDNRTHSRLWGVGAAAKSKLLEIARGR